MPREVLQGDIVKEASPRVYQQGGVVKEALKRRYFQGIDGDNATICCEVRVAEGISFLAFQRGKSAKNNPNT